MSEPVVKLKDIPTGENFNISNAVCIECVGLQEKLKFFQDELERVRNIGIEKLKTLERVSIEGFSELNDKDGLGVGVAIYCQGKLKEISKIMEVTSETNT